MNKKQLTKASLEPEYRIEFFRRLAELKNKPVPKQKPIELRIGDKVFKTHLDRSKWVQARIKYMGLREYYKSITNPNEYANWKDKRDTKEKAKIAKRGSKKEGSKKEATNKQGDKKASPQSRKK